MRRLKLQMQITADGFVAASLHDIPVADAHGFAQAIAGSKLVVYPAKGHFTPIEVPDQSAADARAFLLASSTQ